MNTHAPWPVTTSGSRPAGAPASWLTATTPVIVAARRTPIATVGRALAQVDVVRLAAAVLGAVARDVAALGIDDPVDDVVLGNTRGPGGNIARVAALAAGLGAGVTGATIDRQCGSGQAAVHTAASEIASGQATLMLAGGAESASTQPLTYTPGLTVDGGAAGATSPQPYTRAPFAPTEFGDPDMGPAAQLVADECGVTRARQDAYAVRSHRLALASRAGGQEEAELVPFADLPYDDRPRVLKASVLQRFPGSFVEGGSVTAGNSCGVSDGAAVLALVPEWRRAGAGVPGLALRGWTQRGVDPCRPGLGPVPAVDALLQRCGLTLGEVDVLEITEAFAGQVLACTDAWGLDPLAQGQRPVVCPQGGAIARGHPWGASGALLLVRLFSQLVRSPGDARRGIATCAVGGGQGLALLAERVG